MKIGTVSVKNFQSYKALEFDYANLGLTLISGETGSGKSTFLDATAWTLFGITSKEAAADDVRAWDADGPTVGHAWVDTPKGPIEITRVRGPGKNDLYWQEDLHNTPQRGKDMTDTQRLLEAVLGVTADLFLTGSYLTQFSKADSFFIAKAKERRDTLEQIADQEFAIALGQKASDARKIAKKELEGLALQEAREAGTLSRLQAELKSGEWSAGSWASMQVAKIEVLRRKLEQFTEDKALAVAQAADKSVRWERDRQAKLKEVHRELDGLPPVQDDKEYANIIADLDKEITALKGKTCSECGGPSGGSELEECRTQRAEIQDARRTNQLVRDRRLTLAGSVVTLHDAIDPYQSGLEQAKAQVNPYGEQLLHAESEVNPYLKTLKDVSATLQAAQKQAEGLKGQLADKEALVSQLSWLYDKSFELRGLLMTRVVSQIESQTNAYLERFFDAALRVTFTLADSDKLEVELMNGGYSTSFKSLSGGERCMLKLAFSLSLMKAAQDKAGVSFGMILLDEPFNGLSDNLKVRAFGLLQQLEQEYPTVLVIDHSPELKAQFSKVFNVSKVSGNSEVHEQQNN